MTTRQSPIVEVVLFDLQRGEMVLDLQDRLISFSYEDSDNKADKFAIVLDNYDLSLFDSGVFLRGQVVGVSWGYAENMSSRRLMMISKIKGFQQLTIEGLPYNFTRMNQRARSRNFADVSASDIANLVCADYETMPENVVVQESPEVLESTQQAAETDDAFLRRLASRYGWIFYADDTGFHFHERNFGGQVAKTYIYHTDPGSGDIKRFEVSSEVFRRTGGTRVRGRDPEAREDLDANGDNLTTERDALGAENDQTMVIDLDDQQIFSTTNEVISLTQGVRDGTITPEEQQTRVDSIMRGLTGSMGSSVGFQEMLDQGETTEDESLESMQQSLEQMAAEQETMAQQLTAEEEATRTMMSGAEIDVDDMRIYPGDSALMQRTARQNEVETSETTAAGVQARANSRYRLSVQRTFEASMDVVGDPQARAKRIIEIQGISNLLSGKYYVKEAKHEIGNGGYGVKLKLMRDGSDRYATRLSRNRSRAPSCAWAEILATDLYVAVGAIQDFEQSTGTRLPQNLNQEQLIALNGFVWEHWDQYQGAIEERYGRPTSSLPAPPSGLTGVTMSAVAGSQYLRATLGRSE